MEVIKYDDNQNMETTLIKLNVEEVEKLKNHLNKGKNYRGLLKFENESKNVIIKFEE